jgi:putative transposase
MPHPRRPYPAEFHRQIVELVRSGRDPTDVAREFEPSAQAIRNWVAQADRTEDRREAKTETLTAAEREELIRLRREVRQLRLERDILSKAAAWFARETGAVRAGGLVGASRRRRAVITTRRDEARPAPHLVERHFRAEGPNQLWVGDITYVPTAASFLYLAVVLDAWRRRIVGWAMANHLRTELVLDALEMAIGQRKPSAVIHHSDQGSQSTALAFGNRCREAGVRPSMGSVGDACDNARAESFFATLECELLDRRRFASQAQARMAVFTFIKGFYNPLRRHSALGYRSPIRYEKETLADPSPAS